MIKGESWQWDRERGSVYVRVYTVNTAGESKSRWGGADWDWRKRQGRRGVGKKVVGEERSREERRGELGWLSSQYQNKHTYTHEHRCICQSLLVITKSILTDCAEKHKIQYKSARSHKYRFMSCHQLPPTHKNHKHTCCRCTFCEHSNTHIHTNNGFARGFVTQRIVTETYAITSTHTHFYNTNAYTKIAYLVLFSSRQTGVGYTLRTALAGLDHQVLVLRREKKNSHFSSAWKKERKKKDR